jgi:hypothetical protein
MKKSVLLIVMLFSSLVFAKQKIRLSGHYTHPEGFCSTVLEFINDSIYTSNHGCEGPGHTYYGRYFIKSDSLFLKAGLGNFKISIQKIDTVEIDKEVLELKFVDQQNQDLTAIFKVYYSSANGNQYSLEYNNISKSLVCRNTGNNQVIRVSTLERLGVNNFIINTNFPHKYRIIYHLEIPDIIYQLDLFNKDITQKGKDTLIIKGDQLISFIRESQWSGNYNKDSVVKMTYKKDNY